jgi:hypothetical protein
MGKSVLPESRSLLTFYRLKVLSLLGLDEIVTKSAPHCTELRDQKLAGEDLGVSHLLHSGRKNMDSLLVE